MTFFSLFGQISFLHALIFQIYFSCDHLCHILSIRNAFSVHLCNLYIHEIKISFKVKFSADSCYHCVVSMIANTLWAGNCSFNWKIKLVEH